MQNELACSLCCEILDNEGLLMMRWAIKKVVTKLSVSFQWLLLDMSIISPIISNRLTSDLLWFTCTLSEYLWQLIKNTNTDKCTLWAHHYIVRSFFCSCRKNENELWPMRGRACFTQTPHHSIRWNQISWEFVGMTVSRCSAHQTWQGEQREAKKEHMLKARKIPRNRRCSVDSKGLLLISG